MNCSLRILQNVYAIFEIPHICVCVSECVCVNISDRVYLRKDNMLKAKVKTYLSCPLRNFIKANVRILFLSFNSTLVLSVVLIKEVSIFKYQLYILMDHKIISISSVNLQLMYFQLACLQLISLQFSIPQKSNDVLKISISMLIKS